MTACWKIRVKTHVKNQFLALHYSPLNIPVYIDSANKGKMRGIAGSVSTLAVNCFSHIST